MKFAYAPLAALMLCTVPTARAVPVVFSAGGSTAAAVQSTVDAFRSQLGALNVNVAGSFGSGRREINWDGVPDALAAPNNLPANFFNVNSPRGAVFSTPGTGFQVSANSVNPGSAPVEFGNLNATYPGLFQTFSPQRLFTSLGSNVTDVAFFVPGSSTVAGVAGFGAVFSDVDLAATTSLQFFDLGGKSLGTYFAPPVAGNETLSFVGVRFDAGELVGRVRITAGNAAFGANESGSLDLVAMDDFIYAEPVSAVPEPTSWAMMAGGLATLAALRRRRRS